MTWTCAVCQRRKTEAPALEHQHLDCCGVFTRVCTDCKHVSIDPLKVLAADHQRQHDERERAKRLL